MSLHFLFSSQTELQLGFPWLKRFSVSGCGPIHLVVAGNDRQTLLRVASNVSKEHAEIESVSQIESDQKTIKQWIRESNCKTLVMVSDHDNDDFEKSLFELSSVRTIWIRPKHDVPESGKQIFSLNLDGQTHAASIVQRYLNIQLEMNLLDESDQVVSVDSRGDQEKATGDIPETRMLELERQRCDAGDLVVVAMESALKKDPNYPFALGLMNGSAKASVLLYHSGDTVMESISRRLRAWMAKVADPMERDHRIELSKSLHEGSQPSLEFLGLISASSMLAAFGLLQDSAAVIIGAMLIAPLMTPILGAGLSLAHGNRSLFYTSFKAIALGFAGALAASFLFGLLVRWTQGPSETNEMLARCNPSPLDFCVGLVGGIAASYARTRVHLSGALAGAAIAAALVPPIATAGLQLAFGHFSIAGTATPILGPLLLVSINVITIMVGSSFVLYARGMHDISSDAQPNRWGLRMFMLLTVMTCLVLVAIV